MELRQLRYFVAVAEEGNISRAAKKIFLTQPALSRQIKALEDKIGQCLLERQAHSIRLTPVGESLLREARELLQHAEQMIERVRSTGRGVRLRVGYAPSLAAGMLSAAVENFTQAHPNARVELFDLATKEMLAGLESDKLDVAVTVGQQQETRGLVWTPLARVAWQVAVNYGDSVTGKSLNWTHRNHQRIGVAVADSPNGPWQRVDMPMADVRGDTNAPDALVATNPSVTQRPDGGVLMIYKAVGLKRALPFGGPVVHLVATADSPTGPYTKRPSEVFSAEGVMFAAEDPFIWRGTDRYWAVVKDNAGHLTKRGYSLALLESADGIDWKLALHPLFATPEVTWEDGRKQKLDAMERPQLLFDNGVPIALLCAAADAKGRDGSFNIHHSTKGAEMMVYRDMQVDYVRIYRKKP